MKCKECEKEYDDEEVRRVYGDIPADRGMCSSQCYTASVTKSKENTNA